MKVKKNARRQPSTPADIAALIKHISDAPDNELVSQLEKVQKWVYPRGDLYSWSAILDRFDALLEAQTKQYNLETIQVVDFTASDKQLILEILRFTRLLLENSTNRKSFASYDRLYDLMLTSDLDVLYATLYLLLRSAQQYGHAVPFDRNLGRKLTSRLVTLAKGFDKLRSATTTMQDLTSDSLTVSEDVFHLTTSFYPTQSGTNSLQTPSKATARVAADTSVSLILGDVREIGMKELNGKVAAMATSQSVPVEDQFDAVNKARWLLSFSDIAVRKDLLAVRLMAIAVYAFITNEDAALTTVFLYEPDLVAKIAELLKSPSNVDSRIQAAAAYALDACAHHRSKLSEVLSGLSANLNHGIFFSALRHMSDSLMKDSGDPALQLADSLFTLTAFISATPNHAQMLIGAGIMPLLLSMLDMQCERRVQLIPRVTGLIDNLMITSSQALPIFTNMDGVGNVVNRIKTELDAYLTKEFPEPSDVLLEDTITTFNSAPLRSLLRTIHKLMQAAGGSDGVRNLVDSDLPKTLKQIFANSARAGPKLFSLAINVMATFVHNEPTSLSILQELQLPQTLIQNLEQNVPVSYDVMITVPNAIGAICLNAAGLAFVSSNTDVLVKLINAIPLVEAPDTSSMERDPYNSLGQTVDELARHHPTLRPVILEAAVSLLRKTIQDGSEFVPPVDELCDYTLEKPLPVTAEATASRPIPTNSHLTASSKVFKFLAGLLRNGALSGDFIKADGLSLLVNIGQHPFVPVRFFETEAASYLSNIMRNIGHHDHVKLVQSLAAAIQQTLQATTKFWQGPSALDNWIALKDSASAPDPSGELRKLQGLSTTLNLLSDALGGHGFSNSRLSVTLMKALGLSEGSTLVSDLAALQRVAFMGHVRLKESATKGQSPSTATPSTVLGIEDNGTKSAPAESGAKRMATRLHGVSIQVFKSMIKLLYSKRAMDASHKKEAELLAGAISTEIQKHLEIATDVQTATVALGLATIFLFDERAQEGYVNIVLFSKFEKMGGIKTLVSTIERVVDNVEEAVEAADPSDDQETTSPFARANVGLRVALMICSALVSPKSLVENPQILNNPRQGEPDAIEPSDLLVKMRLAFGPIIHRVWTANWITSTPTAVIRLAVRAFLVIMGGNNEEPTEPAPPPALRVIPVPPVVRAPLVAIPERVNMLVDMGFPRGTAEAALVRARNDIAGAAELILTMPHLFDGVANDEPEPEPVAAVEGPEGGENGQAEPAQSNAAPENEEAAAVPAPEAVADPATIAQDMELDSAPASGEQATDTTASGSEQPPADSTAQSSQTTDSTMEVDQTPTVPIRQQLNELRATWKDDIATHAMEILECAEDLAFDLMPSLPKGTEGVSLLFSQTLDLVEKISEEKAKALSARLRLLAIFIRLNDDVQIGDDALSKAAQIVAGLKIDTDPRPRWMTSLLLFVESILSVADNVLDVKLGHDSVDNIMSTVPVQLTAAIEPLVKQTIGMVADSNVTREELLSGLRVLAIVTRRNPDLLSADDIANVLRSFRQPPAKIQGCQPFAAMIVRHTFERSSTLQETVGSQVKHYLTPQRNKVTDVNHFVKQLRHVAARDPQQFIKCVEQECALVDALPPTSVYHIRPRKDVKDVKAEGTMAAEQDQHLTSVMDMLLLEIEQTLHILRLPAEEDEKSKTAAQKSHSYLSLLVSVVTELVGSYLPAKTILLASWKKQAIVEGHKASLSTIVTELICNLDLNTDLSVGEESIDLERARKREISSWWGSCVVALCSDVTASTDLKDVSEELANVRRTVLDTLLKAFKDAPTGNAGVRYGRYWALGELIYHLLAATSTTATSDNDSSKMHLAKLMLEKNYVNQLTAIIGEIDLNYPGVRVVLASLLKALEHLTKISVKWGKADTSKLVKAPADEIDDDDEEEDVDMESDDEQEGPDMYRNSALGMLGGDAMDDDDEDDEDDEEDDEDDMMDGYDDTDEEGSGTMSSMSEGGGMHDDEGIWVDEDDGDEIMDDDDDGETDSHGQEVVIGDPEMGDDDQWDEENDEDGHGDELSQIGHLAENVFQGEEFYDEDEEGDEDEDDMDDMVDMDELGDIGDMMGMEDMDDMDELDDMEDPELGPNMSDPTLMSGQAGLGEGRPSQSWGWLQGGQNDHPLSDATHRSISRLLDRGIASSAMFGSNRRPPASGAVPAQHPLMMNPGQRDPSRPLRAHQGSLNELYAALELAGGREAIRMLEELLVQAGQGGTESVRINFSEGENGSVHLSIGGRSFMFPSRRNREPATAAQEVKLDYSPQPTAQRWQDELSISPARLKQLTSRLALHIINRLLPEAKRSAEEEAEKRRTAEEGAAAVAARRKEEEAKEKAKNREEELARAAAVTLPESRVPTPLPAAGSSSNQDVDMPQADAPSGSTSQTAPAADPAPEPEPSLARTVVSVRGQDVDITDTGIDLEFLQALPEDMRADVIEQHMREHNRTTRNANTAIPSGAMTINSEFLDALPPEIRAEVMMQEQMENARRNRPAGEQRAVPPNALPTEAMSAGFLAALSSELEDVMMLNPRGGNMPNLSRILGVGPSGRRDAPAEVPAPPKAPRDAIQLLDKPGIAAIVRLLFFPEAFRKGHLFRILGNLCVNSTTRSDLLNLLLSVVQDGSGDLLAVDRSFQQMSLRALSTPKSTSKAQVAESPAPFGTPGLFVHLQSENIPIFIAQRCLEALTHIVTANNQAVNFFLTEQDHGVGLKKFSSKKGKGKDRAVPQTKYPIVVLLGLLDRISLVASAGIMESLTALLVTVTRPLASIKKSAEPESKDKAPESAPPAPASATAVVEPSNTSATEGASGSVPELTPADKSTAKTGLTAPPVIPASVLRLVINTLTVGECSSRNFTQSLVTMQNLCYDPSVKEILLNELKDCSATLGQALQGELASLGTALGNSAFDANDSSLIAFSAPTSRQARLLRLLKTIEYLHLSTVDSDPPGETMTDSEAAVSKIFASFDFDPLWTELRRCLDLVEDKDNTEQIALVLLPLVETLMVICKYRRATSREVRSPSAPPVSASPDTSDLFLSFTTTHRKILNAIVRNTPALLSGSFSLLIRNSKVLDFDNKRHWFFQKLKKKKDEIVPSGHLHLNVRRQYVFEDSFRALRYRSGEEIKYGKLGVKFTGEDGIDAGGVSREWFSVLAQQIFDPNFALFEPCAADQQTYQPNKHSSVNEQHLAYFKFIGHVIGKAVYDGRLLDAYFSRAFYKQILGRSVDIRDLESIDPEYHKSLQWMLDNDITNVIDQEFTIEDDQFGETKVVELKENGASIPVTEENKEEYVRLVVSYRLDNSIKEQNKAFLQGFYEIIPRQLIQIFEPDQLELLISGITTVDVDELKNSTQMSGWKSTDPEVGWFWRALRSLSQEERSRFLMFVTSSSRVPLGGFTQLQGASGIQPFQLQKLYSKEGSLPQASTCFNLLLLPTYSSYEQLREKLMFAVTETGGFGKS